MTTILHTADWHLGANLYNETLDADHELFIRWLTEECIPAVNPQVLLISGDVFNKANPSGNARKMYFQFLAKLVGLNIKQVIITAGNHDSAAMLEAPKELLEYLNIHIVGNAPKDPQELLIPVKGDDNKVVAIIAAVPFLRDQDVRVSQEADNEDSREAALKKGIYDYFDKVFIAAESYKSKGIPLICMGHLFASGVTVSDSERPVQVGGLADVGANCFPKELVDYVALGHIHRPQSVQNTQHIWYSGSPVALSFSEWAQKKSLRILNIEEGIIQSSEMNIPSFRNLIRLQGTFDEVKDKESKLTNSLQLPAYLDITITEQEYNPAVSREIAAWIQVITGTRKDIHKVAAYRYSFLNKPVNLSRLSDGSSLQDTTPAEVFNNLLLANKIDENAGVSFKAIFQDLLDQIQKEEN